MDTKYIIKNFRVFDEDGISISLKPLTLLTGCNSSGKSSLVKSLLLISDYLSAVKMDVQNGKRIDLTAHRLDFTKYPHNSLGRFSKTVNNKSDNQTVTFGFQTHSDMLCQDINVEFVFAADKIDITNGYIRSFSVKKQDGTTIYCSDVDNKSTANLYAIFDEFVLFASTQHLISTYESIDYARRTGESNAMSDEKFKEFIKEMKMHSNDVKAKYGKHVLIDINRWNNANKKESFVSNYGNPDVIKKVKEYGILYYIPFIGEKLDGGKENVCIVLEKCKLNGNMDKATSIIVDKIINDFKDSPFDSFIEYYKSWEKSTLVSFKMWNSLASAAKYPNVPDARGVGIDANTITMSPYHTTPLEIFEKGEFELSDTSKEISAQKKREDILAWEAEPLTFDAVYEALCILSETYCSKSQDFFRAPTSYDLGYSCITERMFLAFAEEAIKEVVINAMPNALLYVSSSVINVKRLYPLESADEFTQTLKRFVEAKRNLNKKLDYVPNTFFNKWVKAFGIGEKVSINVDSEGLGITLRLHKDESDMVGSLLADNGYGITQLFALLLNIEVSIMERVVYEKDADDFIGAYTTKDKLIKVISSPTVAIEEPEIHLHPSYQSMLAEMFYDAYINYGIHFLIETHSEYLIRKSQLIVSRIGYQTNDEAEEKCPFATYYVPQSGIPYSLGYRKDGKFVESFGTGFYDEASNLAFEIL